MAGTQGPSKDMHMCTEILEANQEPIERAFHFFGCLRNTIFDSSTEVCARHWSCQSVRGVEVG